ncbi:dihydrolipoyl dehydrogenase [Spirochaeta africana]|uniref:Dihydrolipoyl dehydrogenase n=1 Tax=Spirochaeta africana (strain ATCC 700263 / DSM 8902 / Z-7692) TaxID=889378 RepID=H9UK14_SPIAZ|nr:dihydrolipoyl dehydrogenase [Spirochaeta africana]AFG37857.1 dihydrolipoamide dehydrogenase [Spirochaeta africana DSM 8902]
MSENQNYDYDVVIIGAGPGGYVAAIRANQLGLKPVVIEKDKPGGVCLNIGCIPSKSLIHQADVFRHRADLAGMGLKIDESGFDYSSVFKKSRAAAQRLSKGVQSLLKKNKVEYVNGEARITGPHEVTVDGDKKISGKAILIATGSRPREIPGFEFDEKQILSSTGALMLEKLPKSLVIMGAGAIGMEFAFVMNAFGVEVTVVELLDRVLPLEDEETAAVIAKDFEKSGITMLTGTKATGLKKGKTLEITVQDKDGKESTLKSEKLLVAVGRAPNTEGLGLEEVGVTLDRGFVRVGDYYRSSVDSIFAIGDVTSSPLLAHVASKEGEIAIEYLAGHHPEARIDPLLIPSAVYCEPQIGSFGYTEAKAKEAGVAYKTAVFPYRGAGKAVAIEQPEGLVKLLFNPETKAIIGGHVVGSAATELIHEILLAAKAELLPEDIATMVHAHPTISEAVMESARQAEGWAIHF